MTEAGDGRRLSVARVEVASGSGNARVFLSDGSELIGLTDVDANVEALGIPRFAIEGYIMEGKDA